MKSKTFLLTTILLLLSLAVFCKTPEEVKQIITKEFPISKDGEVIVINKYGNLVITEWTKNEVSFTVEITGKGEKAQTAQEMVERVSIDFNKTGNKISAETVFKERKYSCNNCGTTVNYTIKVPTEVYLNLTNKYGNINLSRTNRPFKCELKYGNLMVHQLSGTTNTIWLKYGDADIDKANDITLDLKYGNLNLKDANLLKLNSAYSKIRIGNINELNLTSRYDNFNIETLGKLDMTTGYSNFNIEELKESFIASVMKYGKLKIDKIAVNFTNISIDAAYTPIRLNITSQHNFRAQLYTRYGNIKTNGLQISDIKSDTEKDRFAKSLTGIVGTASNPTAKINISDRYADIILEK